MYHLLRALGLTAMRDSIACAGHQYQRTAHVMAVNLEKYVSPGKDYDGLGLSTRGSDGIYLALTHNREGNALPDCDFTDGASRCPWAALPMARPGF